jgi:teichuronic acid biosynthesis glycosyltransferase TuaC
VEALKSADDMKVLIFTNMFPFAEMPFYGSFVKDEVEALRKEGCEADVLFVNGISNKVNYLFAPFRFSAAVKRKKYDIIHCHHSFCSFIACMPKRAPVIWTFHEGEIAGGKEAARKDAWIKRLAYSKGFKRRVAGKVDAVVTVAGAFKEPLGREDAFVLPSGIDTELFTPVEREEARRELGLDMKKYYVLFLSTPSRPEKRFALAKAAITRAKAKAGEIEMLCLDNVPHERVPVYMNACNLALMTSAFEASPVTIRESLACNVAVVSTDAGDAREMLQGIPGCAVVDSDPDSIADSIVESLHRFPRVDGRSRVEKYSLAATAQRLMKIYNEVLSRQGEAWSGTK